MKSGIINPIEFQKEALVAHSDIFSTPYIAPNAKRKNMYRAICLLADDHIVDVSGIPHCLNTDGSVNLMAVEKIYQSLVIKVLYRPNHDLLHAYRQAAMICQIKAYFDTTMPGNYDFLNLKNLERLQLMMLYAVAGRKDETGFSDGKEEKKYYLEYRKDSAKLFFEAARRYPNLYIDEHGQLDEKQLYHDALMVELMGNDNIPNLDNIYFADEMKKRGVSLPDQHDKILNAHLNFLNIAHALDLLRVYAPNAATDSKNSNKVIKKLFDETLEYLIANNFLSKNNILNAIKNIIALLQYSRKLLDISGDKQTTLVEMDDKKISQIFNDSVFIRYIQDILNNPQNININDIKTKVVGFLTNKILKPGSNAYNLKRFDYCHYKNNSNQDKDRDLALDVLSSLQMVNSTPLSNFHSYDTVDALDESVQQITSAINNSSSVENKIFNVILAEEFHNMISAKGYYSILVTNEEPSIKNMRDDTLIVLKRDNQLIIYWIQNGNLINKAYSESSIPNIMRNLPTIGQSSHDLNLLALIVKQYCTTDNEEPFHLDFFKSIVRFKKNHPEITWNMLKNHLMVNYHDNGRKLYLF